MIILLVRFYWGNPEDQPAAKFPVQSPTRQETGGSSPLSEKKLDFLKVEEPAIKPEPNPTGPAEDSEHRLSAALSAAAGPKQVVPPPTTEKKPVPPAPMPEIKSSAPSPVKEAKKELQPKEATKEKKHKDSTKKTKSTPPDSDKSESKLSSQQTEKKTVIVKTGESIYTIAEGTYGVSNTSVVDRVMEMNPRIADPDLLPANQKIRLPEITEESLIRASEDGSVRVRLGAFMKPEYAHFLTGQPALKGKEIKIIPWKTHSGKTFYRATAGKFDNREEGLQVIRDLKEKGLSPYFEGFKKKN